MRELLRKRYFPKQVNNFQGVIISVRCELPSDLFTANSCIREILFQLISIFWFTLEFECCGFSISFHETFKKRKKSLVKT